MKTVINMSIITHPKSNKQTKEGNKNHSESFNLIKRK